MENYFEVKGEVALIYLKHRRKGTAPDTVVIDVAELPKVQAFKGRFSPFVHPRTKKMYARGFYQDPATGKISQPLLHRLIMNPTRGENTAHVSEDTLRCTTDNMRNVTIGTNRQDLLADIQAERERLKLHEEEQADIARQQAAATAGETFLVPQTTTAGVWLPDLASLSEEGLKEALADLKEAGAIEKGVSFHKQKRRWEVSAFADGVRHRLGYWPPVELELANETVRAFRELGPGFSLEFYRGGRGPDG